MKPKIEISDESVSITGKNFKAKCDKDKFVAYHGDKDYNCDTKDLTEDCNPWVGLTLGMHLILEKLGR